MFKRIKNVLDGIIVSGKYSTWAFPNSTQKLFDFLDNQFISRDEHFYQTSKFIYNSLKQSSFNPKWVITVKNPILYRRVSGSGPGSDPLSITGSFGCGGRFNIGTAQASLMAYKDFSKIVIPRAAHYSSADKITARQEYGDAGMPGSKAITYKLKLKSRKQLKLIDADIAVDELSNFIINFPRIIQGGSLGGAYFDIKKVIPTQLFAHWLIDLCPTKVDGIIFDSQVNPKKRNYCLYIESDANCKKLLTAKKV